jgi:hypothetical protein
VRARSPVSIGFSASSGLEKDIEVLPTMDETEPLEWYERLFLQCVVGYGIAVVSAFYFAIAFILFATHRCN